MILPTKECLLGMMYYLGVWKHLFLYDKNTEVQCDTEKLQVNFLRVKYLRHKLLSIVYNSEKKITFDAL